MKTKPLYILIFDGGDGSSYPNFTFNSKMIEKLGNAYTTGRMTYADGIGCDGDGFHYEVLQVPVECTAESLQIRVLDDDFADKFDN